MCLFECDVVWDTGKEEYLCPFVYIGLDWISTVLPSAVAKRYVVWWMGLWISDDSSIDQCQTKSVNQLLFALFVSVNFIYIMCRPIDKICRQNRLLKRHMCPHFWCLSMATLPITKTVIYLQSGRGFHTCCHTAAVMWCCMLRFVSARGEPQFLRTLDSLHELKRCKLYCTITSKSLWP